MAGSAVEYMYTPAVLFTFGLVAITVLFLFWISQKNTSAKPKASNDVRNKSKEKKKRLEETVPLSKKKAYQKPKVPKDFSHPHLLTSLKLHTDTLTSGRFSLDESKLLSAAEDNTVGIWSVSTVKNLERKVTRFGLPHDYADRISWCRESEQFIVHRVKENTIEVYSISQKPKDSTCKVQLSYTFPESISDEETLVGFDVDCKGQFLMIATNKNKLMLYNLLGQLLASVDTLHGDMYSATLSPCGRYIATTGFTPDSKIWEVKYTKSESFEGIKKVFELTGHSAGILNCSISSDSSRMVTVSKDKTWRLYDTWVQYDKGQDPYLLFSGKYTPVDVQAYVRLSNDGRTIALVIGSSITFISSITGQTIHTIEDISANPIIEVLFDPWDKLVLAFADKFIRVFHNAAGYKTIIEDLELKRSMQHSAKNRERLDTQIREAKKAINQLKMEIKKAEEKRKLKDNKIASKLSNHHS